MSTNQAENVESRDVIVVGANLAGLFLTYQLSHMGFKTTLVEQSKTVGGSDQTFVTKNGKHFDFGLHVLDYMRSEMATRFFCHILDNKVRKVQRRRAIAVRNQLIDYNAPPAEWPEELRSLFSSDDIKDDIGADTPTRARLGGVYGPTFADFIYDEVLPAMPSEARHMAFGVDESEMLTNIYPWFFPRADFRHAKTNASRVYQDRVRDQPKEYLLYPEQGGFGNFANTIVKKMHPECAEVITNIPDLDFTLNTDKTRVDTVTVNGRSLSSPRVIWCAPAGILMGLLGREMMPLKPDRLLLGSFELNRPALTDFNEILFGDPQHKIKRMSFPADYSGSGEALLQIEYVCPEKIVENANDAEYWKQQWLASLQQLGLIDAGHEVVGFDFKSAPVMFNAYGAEGIRAPEMDFSDLPADSNILVPFATVKNVNINTRLPKYFEFLAEEMQANRGAHLP